MGRHASRPGPRRRPGPKSGPKRRPERPLERGETLALQRMELIGKLAAGVAHELGNVLNVVGLEARLIHESTAEGDSRADLAERIVAATRHGAWLVRQLRALSRSRAPEPVTLDLIDATRATLALVEPLLGKSIKIELHEGSGPAWVRADRTQIDQVILSLAVRARDAMAGDAGKIDVFVSAIDIGSASSPLIEGAPPGQYVLLSVRDSTDQATEHAAEAPNGWNPRMLGAWDESSEEGLLHIAPVVDIVEQHGGFVDVVDDSDRGSTFRILLPAARDAQEALAGSAAFLDLPAGDEAVLLVERNVYTSDILSEILLQKGYEVHVARSVREALAMCARPVTPFRALVVSQHEDDSNGTPLVTRFRRAQPQLAVVLLDHRTERRPSAALESEGAIRLPPPIGARELLGALRTAIDASASAKS